MQDWNKNNDAWCMWHQPLHICQLTADSAGDNFAWAHVQRNRITWIPSSEPCGTSRPCPRATDVNKCDFRMTVVYVSHCDARALLSTHETLPNDVSQTSILNSEWPHLFDELAVQQLLSLFVLQFLRIIRSGDLVYKKGGRVNGKCHLLWLWVGQVQTEQ